MTTTIQPTNGPAAVRVHAHMSDRDGEGAAQRPPQADGDAFLSVAIPYFVW
jgi:hypothetical protein